MLWDTNVIIKQIEQHMTGEIPFNEEFNSYNYSNIPDKLYSHYNFNYMKKEGFSKAEKDKIEFELKRNYVLHNFKDGIMKFTYSLQYYDKNNEMQYSDGNIPVALKIHKKMVSGK